MSDFPTESSSEAQQLFQKLLEDSEEDPAAGFDGLCERHPEHREEFDRLFDEWMMLQSFAGQLRDRFGGGTSGDGSSAPSADVVLGHFDSPAGGPHRFTHRGELGRGGMGIVHRVWDADFQRDLAMKVLKAGRGSSSRKGSWALARFLTEAQITGQLDHPGIVPVHELGVDESGQPYFTMSVVKGRELSAIFRLARAREEGWSPTRVIGVLLKVCETLAYAHSRQVVHRDLKPSNVMVGRFGEVYVMDWGLAKSSSHRDEDQDPPSSINSGFIQTIREQEGAPDSSAPWMTVDGTVLGTPAYMPPEQAVGRVGEVGPQSDVYSVGAMLYELLVGRPPYSEPESDQTPREVVRRILREPPTALARAAHQAPPELQSICERAMSREVADRYRDMADMASDLQAYLENRVVSAHASGAFAQLRKWIGRNRVVSLLAVALVVLAVGGLGALLSIELEANKELEVANAKADREAHAAQQMSHWLDRMFSQTVPAVARGEEVSATEMIERSLEELYEQTDLLPEVRTEMSIRAGEFLGSLGQPARAVPHYEQALKDLDGDASTDPLRLFELLYNLAGAHTNLTNYDRTEELYARMDGMLSEVTLAPTDQVNYLSRRAGFEFARGRTEEAERQYLECLDLYRSSEGIKPSVEHTILEHLGVVYHRWGRFDEADRYLREALAGSEEDRGVDHPGTLHIRMNLAIVTRMRGDIEESGRLFAQTWEQGKRVWGEDHEHTLTTAMHYSSLFRGTGRYEEARSLAEDAWEIAQRTLPPQAKVRLHLGRQLATIYRSLGQYQLSHAILEDEIRIRRESMTSDPMGIVLPLYEFALAERTFRRYESAEALLQEGLGLVRKHDPGKTIQILDFLNVLGLNYLALEEPGKAELMFDEAYAVAEERLDSSSLYFIRSSAELGAFWHGREDYDLAEPLLEDAVELAKEHLPESSPNRWRASIQFATMLRDMGSYEEAFELAKEVLQHCPKTYNVYDRYEALYSELEKLR